MSYYIKTNDKEIYVAQLLFFCFVFSISFGPILNVFGYSIGMISLFIMILLGINNEFQWRKVIFFIPFILFILLKKLQINDSNVSIGYFSVETYLSEISKFCIAIFLLPLINPCSFKIRRIVFPCFFTSIFFSILILIQHGNDLYRKQGVDGGILLAPQTFLLIAILISMLLLHEVINKRENRLLKISGVVCCGLYVIFSSYTTQMFFFFLGLFFVVCFNLIKDKVKLIVVLILSIFVTFFASNELSVLIDYINDSFFTENEDVNTRLNEVSVLLRAEKISSNSDFNIRILLIEKSMESFFENYFLGLNFNNYNFKGSITVGSHSQWTDDLARLGLLGMSLWMILLKNFIDLVVPPVRNNSFHLALFFLLILYGFFNPFVTAFFVFWLYIIFMMETEENEKSI